MKTPRKWIISKEAARTHYEVPVHGGAITFGFTNRRSRGYGFLRRFRVLIIPKQVHSRRLRQIVPGHISGRQKKIMIPDCDALITALPDIALTVKTADCLPIIFLAPQKTTVIAIAHAGWRGLHANLPALTAQRFAKTAKLSVEELIAVIGPAIRACCYKVGPEVARHFPKKTIKMSGVDRYLDISKVASLQLRAAGIPLSRIHDTGQCTFCHKKEFHSYRRHGARAGRNISWIARRQS